MTEREAAEKLAALLNEIQEEGYEVALEPLHGGGYCIGVGDYYLPDPPSHGAPWEVKS